MFRVTARTVLELGSELISSDIIAFYELIKNGFDAKTKRGVEIQFNVILRKNDYLALTQRTARAVESLDSLRVAALNSLNSDAAPEMLSKAQNALRKVPSLSQLLNALEEVYLLNTIVVADTGTGMSKADLTDAFLVLGTPSRKREVEQALQQGAAKSPFLGEKGIGRLSAMRLGDRLRVETARRDDTAFNVLDIDWSAFNDLNLMIDDIKILPKRGAAKPDEEWSGTRIIISHLTEDWTRQRLERMAQYDFARIADPFLDQKRRPRIVLYWNGKRLTIPWMNEDLISHAHARATGTYEIVDGQPQLKCRLEAIDLGFDHPKEIDEVVLAAPDLQGVLVGPSGQAPDTALVTVGPFNFEAHWYNRRRLGAIESIGEMKTVRELQERWSGILLFRDGFRVFPYGDDEDDWLALDRKAFRRSGYTLNKTQFIGRVEIARAANPQLIDQTNREGLRETPEQQVLVGIMQYVMQDLLFPFFKNVERQYKQQKIDLTEAKSEVASLEKRAKDAIKTLRSVAREDKARETVDDLQQTLLEFSEFAERARQRIAEVEDESRQMIEMAGVGLMVEVVAHELARAAENALENLEALRNKKVPEEVRARLESLRAEMKSLSKRVRILDPLSVSGRQRAELFNLQDVVTEILEGHVGQFQRESIIVSPDLPATPIRVRAVKGMIVQVVENLISNSVYWLAMRKTRHPNFSPKIRISMHGSPPTLIYEDNGTGIAPENRDKIFRAFFSLKEKAKRRGLGLFIARECAEYNGGSLTLDDHIDHGTGRLHRFTLELPESTSAK
ncbi:MAG: sensor histidine kinase [Acidobacteria bacterium]|nr:sensor histidine kinase [Acidobacteriota bacterium]